MPRAKPFPKENDALKVEGEEWRDIPPLPFYQASSIGRIRSLDRRLSMPCRHGGTMQRSYFGRILRLKPKPNGWGQIYLSFYSDGAVYWQVNRAVCWAFNGAPPTPDHEAAHLDGMTENNFTSNLVWATPKENASHKLLHGTASIGSKNGAALLDEDAVQNIIAAYAGGASSAELALFHKVSKAAIVLIISGRNWPHVTSIHRPAAVLKSRENMLRGLSWNH